MAVLSAVEQVSVNLLLLSFIIISYTKAAQNTYKTKTVKHRKLVFILIKYKHLDTQIIYNIIAVDN